MVRMIDTSIPVLVLKSVGHGGLCIARSLGRIGVPVYVADPDRATPVFCSHYCRGRFIFDIDKVFPQKSVWDLLGFAQEIGREAILLPTTDDAAMFVAEHAEELREGFILPRLSPALARGLCSKKEMYHLAKQHGVPTPEAVFPQSRTDVLEFRERAVFPVMLKGIDGRRLWERAGKRMFIIRGGDELLEKYDALEDPADPNLMLQEYIPGGEDAVWMFNGYFDDRSECLVSFTGKKIRQCPAYRGATSLGICLRNAGVERITKDFMKALGYQGPLDIGYRYDARDGLYKVLDVNPRIGATFRLFVTRNGMDVARALYLHLTGQPLAPDAASEGRKWLVEDLDTASSFRYWRDGKLNAREWLESFRGVEETAYFSADDLLPVVRMIANGIEELSKRLCREARMAAFGRSPQPLPVRSVAKT